jgi:N-formylglutamate amidohydrolase
MFRSPASASPAPPGSLFSAPLTFTVEEPVSLSAPVVFASPHSGRLYPDTFLAACRAPLIDLRRIEDAYMDRLLADAPVGGAPLIHGLVGRAVIDLNRAETELDASMFRDAPEPFLAERTPRVEAGLGCLPRVAFNGVGIYAAPLPWREAASRIESIHRPYHRALAALLDRAVATFDQAVLLDWHSMPAEPDRRHPERDAGVEIVLGDRFGAACAPGLTDLVERLFRERGYRTARNAPYAGGYATILHGRPDLRRHALQIEVRRDLYLDELRVEPGPGYSKMRRDIADITASVCAGVENAIE